MKSHDLARELLALPDLEIAVNANGHHYSSCDDALTHGPLQVAIGQIDSRPHIIVGNMLEEDLGEIVIQFEAEDCARD